MRPLRTLWISAVVLGAAMSAESAALAEPKEPASAPLSVEKSHARVLVLRATDAIMADRWAEAEALLRAAWDLEKTYDIAGNLGHVELMNKKPREAAEHLRFCLSALPPTETDAQRRRVQERFEEARRLVAAVRIRVSEPGAEVRVDGALAGTSPLADEVFVDPGARFVTVSLAGYEAAQATVEAVKGGSHDVTIALERTPKALTAATRRPTDKGTDKGKPGDEARTRGPLQSPASSPPGADRGAAPAPEARSAAPLVASGPSKALIVSGGLVAAVGLGTGIGLIAAMNAQKEQVLQEDQAMERDRGPDACGSAMDRTMAPRCSSQTKAVSDLYTLRDGAVIGFSVAGAALAGTALYAILGGSSERGTTVLPAVTRNAGALLLTGVW
jgi:hypothetical protein